jgi:HEAT repeat protein
MIAIQLLGELRSVSAIPAFREMIQTEPDFYTVREIVRSLRKIGGKDAEDVLSSLRNHESRMIRNLVGY